MLQKEVKGTSPQTTRNDAPACRRHGFMRAAGGAVRSIKLGDLLMAAGLLSQAQLDEALAQQKQTGEQLGRILIHRGYVSAVTLYRKLAEQWCLKATAAGVTLLLQTVTPSAARADDSDNYVRLAAAFAPAAIKPEPARMNYPNLFGSTEIRSTDITAFTKWTTVIKRFEEQMGAQASSPRVQMWKAELQKLKGLSEKDQIDGVNSYMNAIKYVDDPKNFGKPDFWATPLEFFSKGGDCEDYAVAKYASLRALGFTAEQMRIAIVQDMEQNIPHALLIVYTDAGTFILDNQVDKVKEAATVTKYKPIFSISSNSWWLHRGGLYGV